MRKSQIANPGYNDHMLLILTHENADFDAVASQMAAHRLYPSGLPLLSWRVNRNVSQFLTLYWDAFGFMRPQDWQRQRVEKVVLVDTTSLPSVRGIRPDRLQVQVIDHHEVTESHGDGWTFHVAPVGATTTLLVEMLQANGLGLTPTEATLLLLGLHEDTGSLVYDTTTARDVRAAAWLMEQGAQLPVVRRFLNIPLSDQQQDLYRRLQDAVVWHQVEGRMIAVSVVAAPEDFEDEISAVAHRLRDSLSPEGLFILVQLKHTHVQLVARSSTDRVDVSTVARALGGGGHSRAAAATIMDRPLAEVESHLLALLPEAVKPMVKVSQIMSYGVQTIADDQTVGQASARMQRLGHEGYPVIDAQTNRLVGLLTRRMVDRAVSHKLEDLPISQVMRAGTVTVRPSDSVEQVQRLMIEEGWGQIPVVPEDDAEPANGPLLGIVTRTDIINLFNASQRVSDERDMRRLMADALPRGIWGMVQAASQAAAEMDMPLYFVGGLVRDLLLGKPPTDIDLVVEGDAIALVRRLQVTHGGEVHSHAQFGTAKWDLDSDTWHSLATGVTLDNLPDTIDFVTARQEFYNQPSALPEVERGSIKLDLHRRDFSINTLAVRLDGAHMGELLDFYGGRRDLEQRLIRVLHSLSFIDDPTRILRAVRLEQRLKFRIESRTAQLMADALPMLDRVTGDRIRHEIELALEEADPMPIMARLAELGVLAQIHPGLTWPEAATGPFRQVPVVTGNPEWRRALGSSGLATFIYFALWLSHMPAMVQEETMLRLKVRKSTRDDVEALSHLLRQLNSLAPDARPSQVVATLRPYPDRVLLTALIAVGTESAGGRQIMQYQRQWRTVRSALDGTDLLAMGLEAGPQIGRLLDRLLAARLDGLVADEAGEQSLLAKWLAE
jgi:tRNA nucleotidyltransferase (CCA-adding enzyme)